MRFVVRLQVRGDAFLARIFDNDDAFDRLDFTLTDMTSSAGWVKARFNPSCYPLLLCSAFALNQKAAAYAISRYVHHFC